MDTYRKSPFVKISVLVFGGLPLLLWILGGFPERSFLKESLSFVTMLSFFFMIGMFFFSRANAVVVKDLKMHRTKKIHKAIGTTCVSIMLLHPLFLVLPRFFEAGVSPDDAFVTIVTTFHTGIVLGMLAWILLLTLGMMALMRNQLPMTYKTWRRWHGILAVVFIAAAAWHAIDLGRHSSLAMSSLIILLTAVGVRLFLKHTITSKPQKPRIDR
ncbi:MAG: FAD/NAD(P)-binding:oxidoreductase [Desulfobacteraceae bacterium]|nr:FAD/NAD(P)-binding:oxidoreductase [Desulfobacteraceae bacterium]MBC2752237.1 ferric reductase-like transmembrane domain-containing protein [Desulfobacteraceae bacterium]